MRRTVLAWAMIMLVVVTAFGGSPVRADSPGYALQFDGANDYVSLAATLSTIGPDWATTKTISLWVKPTGASTVCERGSVAWCDHVFGDRPRWWGVARGVINGNDRIWVWNADGNIDLIGVPYTAGEWTHIAFVHNGGMLRAYKNGVLVSSVASGRTQQPNTGALPVLALGGVINSATRVWTYEGALDEIQIWKTARSAAEIQADMNRALVGDEPGLAAYYRMSDGAGLYLTDDSVNAWNGVLHDGNAYAPLNGSPPQWIVSDAFPDISTPTPTATATIILPTETPTATATPTALPTDVPTATSTPTALPTDAPTATATPTALPTDAPTATATPTALPTEADRDIHADGVADRRADRDIHADGVANRRTDRDIHADGVADRRADRDLHADGVADRRTNRDIYADSVADRRADRDLHADGVADRTDRDTDCCAGGLHPRKRPGWAEQRRFDHTMARHGHHLHT